jgi:hypothetical protein
LQSDAKETAYANGPVAGGNKPCHDMKEVPSKLMIQNEAGKEMEVRPLYHTTALTNMVFMVKANRCQENSAPFLPEIIEFIDLQS